MDTTSASGHADLSRAPVRRRTALVFTDIVGSTRLLASLGDLAGNRRILEHHRLAARVLRRVGDGTLINTAGDSIFLAFDEPRNALRFALRLQRELQTWLADEPGHLRVHDRVGIHFGEVEQAQRPDGAQDLTGFAVSLAFSVMELGSADQILLSEPAFDAARASPDHGLLAEFNGLRWLSHGRYLLKGLEEPEAIFEVGEEGTALLQPPTPGPGSADRGAENDLQGWRPAIGCDVPGTPWIIERFLGDSRFGEVWLARDKEGEQCRALRFCFRPARVRALHESAALFERLKRDVGAHPAVARLHAFQFDHPPYYLESEYVAGSALSELCRLERADAIPVEHRLEIIAQAADALDAAHRAGIVHGDLKPAALVVQPADNEHSSPRVKVTDFGTGVLVARELAEEGAVRSALDDGSLLGAAADPSAPLYWAPELFKGSPPSPASDLYALGVLLYQVLIGDLAQPVTVDVARRIRDPLLLDDLLACLATNPESRIRSAGELAVRLRRLPERRRELARRERRAYWQGALRTGAVAAVVVGLMGWLAWRAMDKEQQATQAARDASRQQRNAEKNAVRLGVATGVRLMEEGDLAGSLAQFVGALRQESGGAARETIHRRRISSVLRTAPRQVHEWRLGEPAVALAVDPGGEWIGAGGAKGHVQVWRLEDGATVGSTMTLEGPVDSLEFAPDHRELIGHAASGPLVTWPWTEAGAGTMRVVSPPVNRVACSPDGRWLAAAGGSDPVWLIARGTNAPGPLVPLEGLREVYQLAFSRDGRLLAGAGNAQGAEGIALWRVADRKLLRVADAPGTGVRFLQFDAAGEHLLLAMDREVYLLDAATLTVMAPPRHHEDLIMWAGTAPRGPLFMSTSAGPRSRALVSDITAPGGLPVDLPHPHSVTGGDLSPDGRYVLTGCFDRHLRLWDPARVQLMAEPARHPAWLDHTHFQVRFLPDGRRAVTLVDDAVRVFDFASHASTVPPLELEEPLTTLAMSPDERLVAGAGRGGLAAVWNVDTGARITPRIRFEAPIRQLLFDRSGRHLAAIEDVPAQAATEGAVWWVDVSAMPPHIQMMGRSGRPNFAFIGPEDRLHVVTDDGAWLAWNVQEPTRPPVRRSLGVHVARGLVTSDVAVMATLEEAPEDHPTIHLWSIESGKPLCAPLKPGYRVRRLAFNRDGSRLVAACSDALLEARPALQWDVPTGKRIDPPLWHEDGVLTVACHPLDSRIITGGEDSLVRVWDPNRVRPLIAEQRMGYQVLHVAFSDDGQMFAAGSVDGTARVWDSETGEPITPVLRHPGLVWRVWFTAGGQHLVTLCQDGRAYIWDIGPAFGTPSELARLAERLSGDADPEAAGKAADAARTGARWEPPLPISLAAIAAWHRNEASLCSQSGNDDLALDHLKEALRATPASWTLHWQRAGLLQKAGRVREACAELREVVQLDPDCAQARHLLDKLQPHPEP